MTFTKLEKIVLAGALLSFGVSYIGDSRDSPYVIIGGVSMVVCAGYLMVSQAIGYHKDIKKMESDYNLVERKINELENKH